MKAKEIQSQLGDLLDATNDISDYNSSGYEDSIPAELEEPDPIFDFNHEGSLRSGHGKAREYLKKIVNSIVPKQYLPNPVIKDKIELDMEQLGLLFYLQETNNVMLKAAMDVVSKGDTQPRMFEVYTKLMLASSDLSKLITELLNQFRKYYIDTYLDLKNKEEEDMGKHELAIANNDPLLTLSAPNDEQIENRYTSTKDLITELHNAKKERFKKKLLEGKNEEDF